MTTCWVRCVNAIHNQNAKSFTNALPQLQDSEAPPRVFTVGASARSKHLNLLPEGGVVTVYDHDELERLRSLVKDMHAPHRKRFGQKIVDAVRRSFVRRRNRQSR